MRELTMYELDGALAEQLPARELMGGGPKGCGCDGHDGGDRTNYDWQFGLVNVNVQNNGDIRIL